MALWLKQSTAVVVSFGSFVDKTDGVSLETGLVSALDHASTGIFLSKNGGALTIRHASVTASSYDAYGMYRVTLDTTDTNTLGTLRMAFSEAATCLPVWQNFLVLPANIYDSLVSGSDLIDVSMTQILGTAVSSPATAGILDVNLKNIANATVSTSTAQLGVNAVQAGATAWGSGAITAASIASDAITDAKVAADVTIASVTGAVGSVTGAVGSVTGAVGSVTGNIGGNVVGSVGSVTGAVGSVTGAVGSVTGNVTGSVGSLAAQAKLDVNAEVVDALNVDTYVEIGQEAPAATQTIRKMLGYLYKSWRNKKDNDGTTTHLFADDAVTVDQKQATSEAAGTVTKGEWATGP